MGEKKNATPITIDDLEAIAKRKLPQNVYDYYASGSDDQICLRRNRDAFSRLLILPRVMVDVSSISTRTTLFGIPYPTPIAFAPSAMQKLAHPRGEESVALAAHKLGVNLTLSSQSTTTLEDVAQLTPTTPQGPERWFQLYLTERGELSVPLMRRAADAGYTALVLTVDTPVLGNRINERKTPLVLPSHLSLANYKDSAKVKPSLERQILDAPDAEAAARVVERANGAQYSASMTWTETISWLRSVTPLKIILKGVLTAEDAELAVKHGVDAIVVSNHGGRQLDSGPATLETLPSIASAVKGKIPILFDGGVRTGSDVFKALALGADFVLVGRPVLWGMSYDGQKGVELAYNILERGLVRTMALAGARDVGSIDKGYLGVRRREGFGIAKL